MLVDSPDGTVVDVGPRVFATLSLFSRPPALGDAIERLESEKRGPTDFAPTMGVINALIEAGALVRPGAGRGPMSGWADPVEHARMLHDDRRTALLPVPRSDTRIERSERLSAEQENPVAQFTLAPRRVVFVELPFPGAPIGAQRHDRAGCPPDRRYSGCVAQ